MNVAIVALPIHTLDIYRRVLPFGMHWVNVQCLCESLVFILPLMLPEFVY